jgi:protein-S-isoprenylcysteine O-methyltransferase Ste14
VLVGTTLTIWSLGTLGRSFGIFPEARSLVVRGPYRWVRHPVYLWEIVSGFALVISKPHPIAVVLFVAFVGLQYWRTIFEERALETAFPEYAEYRARVGRLLPRFR